jgi:ABC-type branched-subunit amino acid transport system substrate-binding protein
MKPAERMKKNAIIGETHHIASQVRCLLSGFALLFISQFTFAQADTTLYKVGLLLPFQVQSTDMKLDEILNAHDLYTANRIRVDDDALIALDFYQGLMQSLHEDSDSVRVELHVYDNWNNDSATGEILKKPELKSMDFIIGSVSTPTAKLVADFCKANKIMNIQPFTPSKSLTSDNPYHLKIAPTIDAHVDNMYQSILDSFPDANIIIYTPKNEKGMALAQRFDSLFINYNKTAETKYAVAMLNTTDMLVDGKKTSLDELIKPGKTNILIITSYDEPFVQSTLRSVYEKNDKASIVVYGLPTWLGGDILRLDYINNLHTRISDVFFADTSKAKTKYFIANFTNQYHVEPSKYAYLGYDVLNFLLKSVKSYGKDFVPQLATQRYTGTAYKFDVNALMKDATTINYYENNHVNVLKVEDYKLKRVW